MPRTNAKSKLLALTKIESLREESSPAIFEDSPRLSAIILAAFVFIFSLVSITSFTQKSPTVDEPIHLFAGYAYVKWSDFRANPEHPPLAKILAALPLLLFEIKDPRLSSPDWDLIPREGTRPRHTVNVAAQMLFVDNDAESLFFVAKLVTTAVAIVLGLFVYRWTTEMFGFVGGLAALFIYALDPNILAHSQQVHTDVPFATFFFIATYFFCRSLNRFSFSNVIFAACFFGLAATTKYAYTSVLVVWAILAIGKMFSSQPYQVLIGKPRLVSDRLTKTLVVGSVLTCAVVTAYLFIWAAYGFSFHAIPGGKISLPIDQKLPQSQAVQKLVSLIVDYRLFPEAWLYGQLHVADNLNRDAYLLGQTSLGRGFWFYFPVAFAVKTPLPTLLLLTAAVGMLVLNRMRAPNVSYLLVPAVTYFALAVWAGINIGVRHILPIYPFLFVLIGGVAAKLWQSKTIVKRGALVLLAAWYVGSCMTVFPDYLAFFNELAGGAKNGHKVLLDSNLDWGQDIKRLQKWLKRAGVEKLQFLYFGFPDTAAPRYYGIDALYLPGSWVDSSDIIRGDRELPNFLAVSVNHLYEYYLQGTNTDLVKSLREIDPVASIGYSIRMYRMDAAIEEFRNRIETKPNIAANYHLLANLLSHQGMTREAIERYRQAVLIDPKFAEAHNRLGVALAKDGRLDEAVDHLKLALELSALPNRTEIQYHLGTILAAQGHHVEAAAYFNEVLKSEPKFVRVYHRLGLIFLNQGNVDRAIEHFQKSLWLDPQYAEAHVSWARALAMQGKKNEAARHYEEAIRILEQQRQSAALRMSRPK
jgi:tetratricopeptide (TPR) repeat protein